MISRSAILCCVLAALAGKPASAHAQLVYPAAPIEESLRLLESADAPDEVRAAAARTLLQHAGSPGVRRRIEVQLFLPVDNPGGCRFVLDALAQSLNPPPTLFPPLAQRSVNSDDQALVRVLPALSAYRSPQSAALILPYLHPARPLAVRARAAQALAILSARDDLGDDFARWTVWVDETSRMTEGQWQAYLATALLRKSAALQDAQDALTTRLVDSLRGLHLNTPPEQRSSLLAGLLTDPLPQVKRLGLELVQRELAASGTLGPEVGRAALDLLNFDDPACRADAAGIVRQLAPPGARAAVLAALARESDPVTAGALLLASTRWPAREFAPLALQWLRRPGPARERAAEAAWQLLRAAELSAVDQREVLTSIRALAQTEISPAAAGILAAIGDAADRARLEPFLDSPSPATRLAAAEALVQFEEFTSSILDAAASDVDLFEPASRAVLIHRPTAAGFLSLLPLPRPAPDLADAALLRVAAVLSSEDLWAAASQVSDPALRRRLLAQLASRERLMLQSELPAQRALLARAAVAYAALLVDDNDPAQALSVLSPWDADSAEGLSDLRATSLLALGRIDEAEPLAPTPASWIRALAMSLNKPHAVELVKHIDDRLAPRLTDEHRKILQTVRDALAAASESAGPEPR